MKVLDREGWLAIAISILISILFFVSETYAQQSKFSVVEKSKVIQSKSMGFPLRE